MKSFFKEIFAYHHHFNQKFIEQVKKHLDELPDRVVGLLSHNINAHRVWNARVKYEEKPILEDAYALSKIAELDRENYQTTLDIITNHDLDEIITYKSMKGDPYEDSIRDILFHVANHHTHHRGQVISDIRQSGIVPIPSDYILMKR